MARGAPAVFVVEYALAQLLMEWGIRPQAMIGYSLGEYTAACLAGVISLGDCLTLVARRARLMEELPPGGMLAVPLRLEEIEPALRDGLGIAVVNGPALHVVSGPEASVAALEAELTAAGVVCRRLLADRAGHSTMMEPIVPRLRELLAGFPLRPPEIPYVSNVTGHLDPARGGHRSRVLGPAPHAAACSSATGSAGCWRPTRCSWRWDPASR